MVILSDLRQIYQRSLFLYITDDIVTCATGANTDTCSRQVIL